MELRQQRVLQSQRRVQAWCAANPGLVPPAEGSRDAWAPITRQLDGLNTIVTEATTAAAQQAVNGKQVTLEATDEQALRTHLRQEMRAVTQVAQALGKTVPGIRIVRMPSAKLQAEGLLKAADAFIKQASVYEPVLVEHALPSDFLAQLEKAASALKASIDGRGAARAGQVSATQQLVVSLRVGKQFVQILDAAVTKALRADPAKLAEWNNIKRITVKGVPASGLASTSPFATPVATVPTRAAPPATQPGSTPEPSAKAA